ncbi:Kelch repeat-containing protein like [Verticillium longisporum]|uniref:Kelch repeat-containing protein like n=1 Tax=Verticillium longisporum TaxID=100787 RepID=A0A8I3AJZ4_VERLO|nr:Kelch repeat-containing protein like [Verticillium longisporum]
MSTPTLRLSLPTAGHAPSPSSRTNPSGRHALASSSSQRCAASAIRTSSLVLSFLLLLFVQPSAQQRDPVSDFCRRFGHQTAVVDDKLFIDGGILNWSPVAGNYTNTWLLYQDLTEVAESGMPQLHANLSKNATIPSVHGGALWGDDVNKRIYLFGGEYLQDAPSAHFELFAYDILHDQWDALGPPLSRDIRSASYGAGVAVSSRGEGYHFGGWLSNASVPDWGAGPPVAITGLVRYSMDSNEWANVTGPDAIRRAEGAIVYIPAGDAGMLVYLGGVQDLYQNGTTTAQPMDEVFLYDVLSSKWYTQETTGTTPERRRRFCAGVTWAEDQSSYNIYLYGGAPPPEDEPGAGFDDLYILSMPSFTWIKMYPNSTDTGDFPHHSLSCNMAPGGAQMLIIGGSFPTTQDCDTPGQWGTHNADLGRQNNNSSPWELFAPNKTSYAVPTDIISVIGGAATGGATKTAPASGFGHRDLAVLMTRKADVAARTPTRDVERGADGDGGAGSAPVLPTGTIVGIALGGLALLAALFAGGCCIARRRRAKRKAQFQQAVAPYHAPTSEMAWSPTQTTTFSSSPSPHVQVLSRPQTVPPYVGPPVELPSDTGQRQYQPGYFAEQASPQHQHVQTSMPAHEVNGLPKADVAWVPHVSMVQVSPGHQRSATTTGVSPMHSPGLQPGQQQHLQQQYQQQQQQQQRQQYSPATPGSEQSLSNGLPRDSNSAWSEGDGGMSPRHETYYHR